MTSPIAILHLFDHFNSDSTTADFTSISRSLLPMLSGALLDLHELSVLQWGMSALHTAAYNGHPDCVRALLDAGTNQGLKAADGRLALDMCHAHANSASSHHLTLEAFEGALHLFAITSLSQ